MTPFDSVLVLLTFALGFALLRAKLCTVACLRDALLKRSYGGILRVASATSAAGIVLLTLVFLRPQQVMLPIDSHAWKQIFLGGAVLGVGSLINGGCYLGSVTYVGLGNTNYLFTLLGIGMGMRIAHGLPAWSRMVRPGSSMQMDRAALIGMASFALVLTLATWMTDRAGKKHSSSSRRSWPAAAALCGALAALVYARHPDWSYGSVIDSIAHADQRAFDWPASASACALFLGAVLSAWSLERFVVIRPSFVKALRCLTGGALMAYGATLIPGGNDTLLLWSIPGLATYGLLAYAAMVITIITATATESWAVNRKLRRDTASNKGEANEI